jgi:hypothetical protein
MTTLFQSPKAWYKLLKWLLYVGFGIGCTYCVTACSLNFGA